jgi:parallel beta-helix repeat protein
MKVSRATARVLGACALLAVGLLAQSGVAAAHGGSSPGTLFVSPTGQAGGADLSCGTAAYSTIQSAVDAAGAWSTVTVCAGSYTEDVIVSTPLTLIGRNAVINGSTTANGTCDQLGPGGPGSAPCLAAVTIKSSHVTIEGFTVQGATGEGILATGSLTGGSIGDVRIEHNRVVGNNLGGIPPTPNSPYPQCSASGQIPGDCGEGIHLMGVYNSKVADNYVSGNEGGVLLTDEFGPTHNNLIKGNTITKNAFDCGVTVPGHNPFALDSQGNPQPAVAGVYDNVIRNNRITDNGLQGEGAGVLFANAGPGTASYDNRVEGNFISGNELSAVTMHAHTLAPGQFEDLNGNQIVRNVIGPNNLGSAVAGPGDSLDGSVTDPFTTGVLVFSGTVPVQVKIVRNHFFGDYYGVWLGVGQNVTASIRGNSFDNIGTPVFTSP